MQREPGQELISQISNRTALPVDLAPQRSWNPFSATLKAAIPANWEAFSSNADPITAQNSVHLHADMVAAENALEKVKASSVASQELTLCCKSKPSKNERRSHVRRTCLSGR